LREARDRGLREEREHGGNGDAAATTGAARTVRMWMKRRDICRDRRGGEDGSGGHHAD